jgi:hypothetical protein
VQPAGVCRDLNTFRDTNISGYLTRIENINTNSIYEVVSKWPEMQRGCKGVRCGNSVKTLMTKVTF